MAIVLVAGLLGFTGQGLHALTVRTLNGDAWLVNTVYRSISLIDGYSGQVTAQVGVPGMGERPVVINSPSGAIVAGPDGRMVKVSDANFTTGTSIQLFGGSGSASAQAGAHDALYAADLATGQIQRLDDSGPGLTPIGPVISVKSPIASPIVAPDGSLYVAVPGTGAIEHLAGDQLGPVAKAGRPGDELRVVLAGTVPVAADLTAGTLMRLGPQGIVGNVVHVPAGFDGARIAGSDTISGLVGLTGSRSVISVDLLTSAVTTTLLGQRVVVSTAVMQGRDVVFIDSTRHRVLIVDTATKKVQPLSMPEHQIPDQLIVQDRLVFVNASGGPSALVINGLHARPVTKYHGPPPVQHHKPTPTSTPTPTTTPKPTTGTAPAPAPTTPVPVKPTQSPHTPGSPKPKPSTPPKPPGAPPHFTATPGNGQVSLSWDPAAPNGSRITRYLVYWYATTGGQPSHAVVGGGAQGTMVGNLSNGVPYTFTVRAVNAVNKGPIAHAGPVTPSSNVPGAPQNVTATTPQPNDSVTLTWTAPDNGYDISSYTVSLADSQTQIEPDVTGTSTVIPATAGLTPGVPVQFQVTAINTSGKAGGKSLSSASVTPFLPPSAPDVQSSEPPAGTSATLSVSCPSTCQQGRPPASYQVKIEPIGTTQTVPAQTSGVAVSVPVTGLSANSSYTAEVTVIDTANVPGDQETVDITTPGPPSVSTPTVTAASGYTKTLEISAAVTTGGLPTTCTVSVSGLPPVTGSCTSTFSLVVPMYNTQYTAMFTATNPDGSPEASNSANSGLDQLTADATDAFGSCPSKKFCDGDSSLEPSPKWVQGTGTPVHQGDKEQADCWTTGAVDYGNISPYTAGSNKWVHIATPQAGYMSILWFPNPNSVTSGLPHC